MREMNIQLDVETHTYLVDGDFATMSVTEMLQNVGISPDYSGVDEELLHKSAERGVEIHKDLENLLSLPRTEYKPQTKSGEEFAKWFHENASCGVAEQPLAYVDGAFVVAGTCDVLGYLDDGSPFIADHKTTNAIHKESVRAQLSVYNYIAKALGKCKINGKAFFWEGAKKFYCFHYEKDGTMHVVELEPLMDEEVVDILSSSKKGERYTGKSLVVEDELRLAVEKAEQTLMLIEEERKVAMAKCEDLRKELVVKMKEQGIKSWETDNVKVTLVDACERESVDGKKLKEEYPQIYKECTKKTKVKESVRVTVRNDV